MNEQFDWKVARCGVEIGVTWFRQYDADEYPRLYIGAVKWYQDEMLAAVKGIANKPRESDMSVTAVALSEHWRTSEWSQKDTEHGTG